MVRAWKCFGGGILLVLSGNDYTAREFEEYVRTAPEWAGLLERRTMRRYDATAADHTFSDAASRRGVESATVQWLTELRRMVEANEPG